MCIRDSTYTTSTNFTSTADATLSQTTTEASPGHVGMELTITGTGFKPNATITINYASEPVVLATATTDSNGKVTLTLGPAASGNLRIWVNEMRVTDYIIATSTLSVTYTPSEVGIGTAVTLYVRPSGSTTEVVESSIVKIEDPHGNLDTVMATDGTYLWTPDELG